MELSRCQHYQCPFSILLIAVFEQFEIYRAQHGVRTSDPLLYSFSMLLRQTSRISDTVARNDDHESALLLPEPDDAATISLCERLTAASNVHPFLRKESFRGQRVTLVIGPATFPDHGAGEILMEQSRAMLRRW